MVSKTTGQRFLGYGLVLFVLAAVPVLHALEEAVRGIIVGPDDAPWITDGGLNAIVRVDPATEKSTVYPLPSGREGANWNTATFGKRGVLAIAAEKGCRPSQLALAWVLAQGDDIVSIWDEATGLPGRESCSHHGGPHD